ncbi:MAG: Cytochrome c4 [uncultured Thiotrichaceae bacterium]|uniref:Cytochrome c4 n=1 Tax=uncultured Thiotrichaceae bacterium TaxID=298394 RepID=A0A6S6T1L3_9GAMM|nr:MAG: Cytochrome c4 [uncultured Thiotrichaceae bacterium]
MKNIFTKTLLGLALSGLVAGSVFASENNANKHSGPSSNIAWDVPQILFVKNGDPERGKQINTEMMCSACHGKEGIATAKNWPNMAGQKANYTYKMLIDYRDEKRVGTETATLMVRLAKTMTEQQMADIAVYYESLPLPPPSAAKLATKEEVESILPLLTEGDGKRMLPPCLLCHEKGAKGVERDTPALEGQRAEYFRKTMQEYKDGTRHNDIYARMRHIAKVLTDEEINAMAQYFAENGN